MYLERFIAIVMNLSGQCNVVSLHKELSVALKKGITDEIKSFIFRSTSLSVADSPSVWHFSSHMGQLLRHSADSMGSAPMGCAMLWPNCPYSSDKLMQISTKVRLR